MSAPQSAPRIAALAELEDELRRVGPAVPGAIRKRRARLLLIATVVTVGVLLPASFTPPGRAVAETVGSLIGIGDEPTQQEHRDAVVIGTGEAKTFPYEVVATGADESMSSPPGEAPTPCISVEFPGIHGGGADCLTDAAMAGLDHSGVSNPFIYGAPAELAPDAELVVQGLAMPSVTKVTITYVTGEGQTVSMPAQLSYLGGELSRKIEVSDEARFYLAFLPPGVLDPPPFAGAPLTFAEAQRAVDGIKVAAYDSAGEQVGVAQAAPGAARVLAYTAPKARFADGRLVQQLSMECARELMFDRPSGAPRPSGEDVDACVAEGLQARSGN